MTTTRYEIRAYKGDKSTFVALTARRTLQSLRMNMFADARAIIAAVGADVDAVISSQSVAGGVVFSDGTVVRFSGRTELDLTNEALRTAREAGTDPHAEAAAVMAHF